MSRYSEFGLLHPQATFAQIVGWREGQSEYAIDAFERNFESDLKTYCNDIKDEIKKFSH